MQRSGARVRWRERRAGNRCRPDARDRRERRPSRRPRHPQTRGIADSTGDPTADVKFYGNPTSPISSRCIIPAGRASIWVSGTTPPVLKPDAPAGSRERFGDTRTQAAGILKTIETQLATHGLSMRDVVYIRAYLVPDATKENKIDIAGWNAAYGEVFNTASNPVKTARSTVGVVALVDADWLIEVEAFAVFPAGK